MVLVRASFTAAVIFIGINLILMPSPRAFVLLSGPVEARLDVSEDQPNVYFVIGDELPGIKDKDKFMGGQYAGLSDQEFWQVLIQEAMRPWNAVTNAYVTLNLDTTGMAADDRDDGVFSILVSSVNLTTAAFAQPNISGNRITDCDITVSTKTVSASSLAYTMLHELGHCLGLGHNHSNYASVMGYSRSGESLELGLDDKLGLTYLYPKSTLSSPQETMGCGVVQDHETGSASYLFLVWLLIIPAVVVLRLTFWGTT